MYFLQQLHKQEIKGTYLIDTLKTGSQIEFLTSRGTFFPS